MLGNGGLRARTRPLAHLASLSLLATTLVTGIVGPVSAPAPPAVEISGVGVGDLRAPAGASHGAHAAAGHAAPDHVTTVRLPAEGQMVAFRWDGGDAAELLVRTRTPGGWSDWTGVDLHADEGPDPGSAERRRSHAVGPLWSGEGTTAVQLAVPEGVLRGVEVDVVEAREPRARWGAAAASATPAAPAVIPRSGWGADESLRDQWSGCDGPSYADNVHMAIVHHTVSVNSYGPDEADDLLRGIYAYHTQRNRWCDIGYNFVVDRFGRAYEGRAGGVGGAVIGAHAGGFNTGSTGVALLGDHRSTSVSSAARGALRALLAWKLGHHGVDPAAKVTVTSGGSSRYAKGTAVTLHTVSGHRDVSSTSCPGDVAYASLPSLRRELQGDVLGSAPFPMDGWTPADDGPKLLALSAYGGLSPAGAQEPVRSDFWAGWKITRAVMATGTGGYTVDAWGGLHPFGDSPAQRTPYYSRGRDTVRALVPGPVPDSGYVVDTFGGVHPFGGATAGRQAGWGWPIGRDAASSADGTGGYVLDGWGGVHPFGTAPRVLSGGYWRGWDIARAIALHPSGTGGYVLDGWGGLHPFGGARPLKVTHYTSGRDVHVDVALNQAGTGGWVLDLDGNIWPIGDEEPVRTSLTWWGTGLGRGLAFAGTVAPEEPSGGISLPTSTTTTEPNVSPEPGQSS